MATLHYILFAITIALPVSLLPAYEYDPNDFATEVVSYTPGLGLTRDIITAELFDDPTRALGPPTSDTTGDNYVISLTQTVPVVCVYQALRAFELVTVGFGGELVVKFNHPVSNDENNPYGIDFILYGNSSMNIQNAGTSSGQWENGNPNLTTVAGTLYNESALVSVSQDGLTWFSFPLGPFADDFAPTLGRMYEPDNPDPNIGSWNQWWGRPTNPTLPLDPNLSPGSFAGMTVAQVAQTYGPSAGGTGFDIGPFGLEWIQYVKIEDDGTGRPEIDAVADVSCCGDYKHPYPIGDVNHDCIVNLLDIASIAENWLTVVNCDTTGAAPPIGDIDGNCRVDFLDYSLLPNHWLECTWECDTE